MDYKKEIVKIIEQMDSNILRFVYHLLKGMSSQ